MKFISVICLGVMALALNAHAVTYRVPDDGLIPILRFRELMWLFPRS